MNVKLRTRAGGLSLVETVIAMLIISVAAIGGLSHQYYAVRHLKIGQVLTGATRTGQLVLEDWQRNGGDIDYDPTILGIGFSGGAGNYAIDVDGVLMSVILSRSTVSGSLQQITVTVYAPGGDPEVTLATYVR